jgi:hypothetical protein
VIILSLFGFLLLGNCIHWEFNCGFDTLEACLGHASKGGASVLGDHTNAVDRGLSNSGMLRVGILNDRVANLWIKGS